MFRLSRDLHLNKKFKYKAKGRLLSTSEKTWVFHPTELDK